MDIPTILTSISCFVSLVLTIAAVIVHSKVTFNGSDSILGKYVVAAFGISRLVFGVAILLNHMQKYIKTLFAVYELYDFNVFLFIMIEGFCSYFGRLQEVSISEDFVKFKACRYIFVVLGILVLVLMGCMKENVRLIILVSFEIIVSSIMLLIMLAFKIHRAKNKKPLYKKHIPFLAAYCSYFLTCLAWSIAVAASFEKYYKKNMRVTFAVLLLVAPITTFFFTVPRGTSTLFAPGYNKWGEVM